MSKENVKKINTTIKDLQKQIENAEKELAGYFDTEVEALFKETKDSVKGFTLERITIGVNNHEFNDGDPTHFSVYHEDATLVFSDEIGEEYEINGYQDANKQLDEIREKFTELFALFDTGNFYESKFGEAYGEITISYKNKIKIEW
jgi:hypothetical protein